MFRKKPQMEKSSPAMTATNPILQHGPAGWLIMKLQRYALLGWGLAALVIVLHFVIVAASSIVPRPVIVVDQEGRIVGNIEYTKASSRTDQEIITGVMHYLSYCLSLNSSTIYEDYAQCINLQTPELQTITKLALNEDNYLQRIEKIKTRSWLEFGTGSNAPAILDRKGMEARVRLKGNIFADVGGKGVDPKPFDVTLAVKFVARNSQNTTGIMVSESRDN